jgi:hypothetical protein
MRTADFAAVHRPEAKLPAIGTPFARFQFSNGERNNFQILAKGENMRSTSRIIGGLAIGAFLAAAAPAEAQGVHFGAGPVHVDAGYPHTSYYGSSYMRSAAGYYGRGWGGYGGYRTNYNGNNYQPGWGGHSHWHDTTHHDYHPGGYVPHYNHYHYMPGHYDVHHSGHWDSHH